MKININTTKEKKMNIQEKQDEKLNRYTLFISPERRNAELFKALKRNVQLRNHIIKNLQDGDESIVITDSEVDSFIRDELIPDMEKDGLADKITNDYLQRLAAKKSGLSGVVAKK